MFCVCSVRTKSKSILDLESTLSVEKVRRVCSSPCPRISSITMKRSLLTSGALKCGSRITTGSEKRPSEGPRKTMPVRACRPWGVCPQYKKIDSFDDKGEGLQKIKLLLALSRIKTDSLQKRCGTIEFHKHMQSS